MEKKYIFSLFSPYFNHKFIYIYIYIEREREREQFHIQAYEIQKMRRREIS